jgi:two-component system sensor histidine kinase KdpD
VSNFFTRANLAVLREIALSHASRLASHEVLDIMRGDRGLSSAAASQRILVAVGPSPHGESLLRWARRLAYALRADLDCLSIETGEDLPERDKRSLLGNLDLARSLGASVTTLPNPDVAKGVVEFATSINASFIVMGKSGLSKARNPFRRPSLAERILKESGNVPVFAVQERPVREALRRRIAARLEISSPSQYLLSIGAIGVVTLANFLIAGYVGYWGASIPYLAMISLLALFVGRGPVLLAAFLSSALWDILFIPPRFTFVIANPADMLMLGLYFLVAMTAGWFTGKLKTSERMLKTRELRLQALSSLASNLAGATGRDSILGPSIASLRGFFDAEAIVLLKTEGGELASQPEGGWQPMDEKTTSAARYCLESGKPAGRDTDTLPLIDWHFVPMQTPRAAIGVIGLRLAEGRVWTGDLDGFFSTMSRTISIALERELLSEENVANTLSRESERLGKVLLDSVSHEMRTPLTIIQGSASALADEDTGSDSIARRILLEQISGGAARLDAIVENLLSMNRLESGSFALRLAESDPEELIAAAIAELDKDAGGHQVRVECRDGPFTLDCDGVLIVQVLVNLLRNAVRYAGDAGPITVRYAAADDGSAFFSVDDSGPGLPEVDLRRVFEKFYRSRNAVPGGCGLGLAICKGIVEAHGGTISASNLTRGGLSVRFTLPHRGLSGEGMTLP